MTKNIKMFVLDEADEMLSRGFKDQIYDIFTKLPTNVQVWWSCCNILCTTKKLKHLQICHTIVLMCCCY